MSRVRPRNVPPPRPVRRRDPAGPAPHTSVVRTGVCALLVLRRASPGSWSTSPSPARTPTAPTLHLDGRPRPVELPDRLRADLRRPGARRPPLDPAGPRPRRGGRDARLLPDRAGLDRRSTTSPARTCTVPLLTDLGAVQPAWSASASWPSASSTPPTGSSPPRRPVRPHRRDPCTGVDTDCGQLHAGFRPQGYPQCGSTRADRCDSDRGDVRWRTRLGVAPPCAGPAARLRLGPGGSGEQGDAHHGGDDDQHGDRADPGACQHARRCRGA